MGLLDQCSENCFLANLRHYGIYLDQALFACRLRTNATTKTSPFYLVYGQQPHMLGDINKALPNDATPEGHEQRIKLLQSARTEATGTSSSLDTISMLA